MPLDMDLAWIINCWRCSSQGEVDIEDAPDKASASQQFFTSGWRKTEDDYQLCPKCSDS